MPTEPISAHLDPDRELQLDVYRLMRRRLHQQGKSPWEIQVLFGEPERHGHFVRMLTATIFGQERTIDMLGRAELVGLHEHLRQDVEAGEREKLAATDWYPDDWRVSLRRTPPVAVLAIVTGGKS